jgi:hypothetical protein
MKDILSFKEIVEQKIQEYEENQLNEYAEPYKVILEEIENFINNQAK